MLHLTTGIFGNAEYAKKLGKQGTANDIIVYNHGSSDGVFTYITVNSEKVQSLLQAINMIDVPVFVLNELNAAVGEQLVAVAEFGFDKGFFILDGVSEDQIKPIIKDTCLENFKVVEEKELVEELKRLNIHRHHDKLVVPIDNYFNVKSVGTVILSLMKGSTIKKHDKLLVAPLGKEVIIKGIQSQDKDIDIGEMGMRVGLNLKGVEADELKRGYVICKDAKVTKTVKIDFVKSRYSKEPIEVGGQVFVGVGMQIVPGRIEDMGLTIALEHPIAYVENQKCLIATTKQALPRIIGSGKIE